MSARHAGEAEVVSVEELASLLYHVILQADANRTEDIEGPFDLLRALGFPGVIRVIDSLLVGRRSHRPDFGLSRIGLGLRHCGRIERLGHRIGGGVLLVGFVELALAENTAIGIQLVEHRLRFDRSAAARRR